MISKIKRLMFLAATFLALSGPAFVPSLAFAACSGNIATQVANGASQAAGNTIGCDAPATDTISGIASKIVDVFSVIVGAAAVIMIIYAGFRYITSGGSSDRVGGAKNSLIYAIVGLVIVAVAQLIVHYVLNQASSLGS